jgi:hypothetical protein
MARSLYLTARKPVVQVFFDKLDESTGAPSSSASHSIDRLADCKKAVRDACIALLAAVTLNHAALAQKQEPATKTGAKVEVTLVPTSSTPIPTLDAKKLWALSVESVNIPSTSASAAADKWGWQAVETLFGKLSFAQIQKHPERDKILDGMKRSEKANFRDWEEQVVIETNKGKLETQQVVIESFVKSSQELEKTVRATLDAKLKIPAKYRPTMEAIINFGKPPETVKYFQEILRNPNNFV